MPIEKFKKCVYCDEEMEKDLTFCPKCLTSNIETTDFDELYEKKIQEKRDAITALKGSLKDREEVAKEKIDLLFGPMIEKIQHQKEQTKQELYKETNPANARKLDELIQSQDEMEQHLFKVKEQRLQKALKELSNDQDRKVKLLLKEIKQLEKDLKFLKKATSTKRPHRMYRHIGPWRV